MHWVNKSNYEVSGLGKIEVVGSEILVTGVIMLPQKNTAAHTDIEAEDVAKAMYKLREVPGNLRFWWHSHVDMATFWSSTDRETIKLCGEGGWCIATVFNKKHERRTAYYAKEGMTYPWGNSELFVDDVKTEIGLTTAEQRAAWDLEYDANVKIESKYSGSALGESVLGRNYSTPTSTTTSGSQNDTPGINLSKKEQKLLEKLKAKGISVIEGARGVLNPLPSSVRDVPDGNTASDDKPEFDLFDENDKMILRACNFTDDEINRLDRITWFSCEEIMEFAYCEWNLAEIEWVASYAERNNLDGESVLRNFSCAAERAQNGGMGNEDKSIAPQKTTVQ